MIRGFNKREPTKVRIHQHHHLVPAHQGISSKKKREKHMQKIQARILLSKK